MELNIVPVLLIAFHQFASGRLSIVYDRLLWFLPVVLATTASLLLNFHSNMLPSYLLLLVLYGLLTLARSSTQDKYRQTLQAFQLIALTLSSLAIVQFAAQFVIDGRKLIQFYGLFPAYVFTQRFNTIIPIGGSSLIKSNGIFLLEPSTMSQIAAIGILTEVVAFRRPRYLAVMAAALLLSYSGTGLALLIGFVPLAVLRNKAARPPVLLVVGAAIALLATGLIDLTAFTSRIGEFENTRASGFQRFVSPLWLGRDFFETASPSALLFGNGPGTTDAFVAANWYWGFAVTWLKLIYEYGLIGTSLFICFLASCLRNSACPGILLAAILFQYTFLGGLLLSVSWLTIIMVLCTLNVHYAQTEPVDRFGPSLSSRATGPWVP
jgi:hypothetical protein